MGLNMSNIHDTRKEFRRELERRVEAEEQCKRAHESSQRQGLVHKVDRGHLDRKMWDVEGTDSRQHI